MKLITKTGFNFFILAVFLFLGGWIIFYAVIRTTIQKNIDNELLFLKTDLERRHSHANEFKESVNEYETISLINPVPENYKAEKQFSDTVLFSSEKNEYLMFRQMKFTISIQNKNFLVQVFKPYRNTDKLLNYLILFSSLIIIVFLFGLFLLTKLALKNSWKSFYSTLDKLKNFDINLTPEFKPEKTDVDEFVKLNDVIYKMTEKIRSDFENLKEYTENTSHELQTPLAVINSKIEMLLQDENLSENQLKIISDIYNENLRLAKINKSLIYLALLDKRSFEMNDKVCPSEIINQNIEIFEQVIKSKNIKINIKTPTDCEICFNLELANVLISNLIKNAVKHNIQNGEITISATENIFKISNTAEYLPKNPDEFFKRFVKGNKNSKSLGIGLSIVKKISDIFEMQLSYSVNQNMHTVQFIFPKNTACTKNG